MSDVIKPAQQQFGRRVIGSLVSLSVLAVLIVALIPNFHRCGETTSRTELFVATACVAFCIGAFLVCPRQCVFAKVFTFSILWPVIYLGMELASYRLFTPDVLRFFHRWNL